MRWERTLTRELDEGWLLNEGRGQETQVVLAFACSRPSSPPLGQAHAVVGSDRFFVSSPTTRCCRGAP